MNERIFFIHVFSLNPFGLFCSVGNMSYCHGHLALCGGIEFVNLAVSFIYSLILLFEIWVYVCNICLIWYFEVVMLIACCLISLSA